MSGTGFGFSFLALYGTNAFRFYIGSVLVQHGKTTFPEVQCWNVVSPIYIKNTFIRHLVCFVFCTIITYKVLYNESNYLVIVKRNSITFIRHLVCFIFCTIITYKVLYNESSYSVIVKRNSIHISIHGL